MLNAIQLRGMSSRRRFLAGAGLAGVAALSLGSGMVSPARADGLKKQRSKARDLDILNFALNLEYLEAEFYLRAAFGRGLTDADISTEIKNAEAPGAVTGGSQVTFATPAIQQYAKEIATDEENHVKFLRAALGKKAVARPVINLVDSFTAAATAAGLITSGQTFDPFADEDSFLLAAFLFEDVGVTAYNGAAPLLADHNIVGAAAGIMAVEAYHASNIRTILYSRNQDTAASKISDARDTLDGADSDLDQGIVDGDGNANIIPTDVNGLAFARTPDQVLNIVYLSADGTPGGFFPSGLNGRIA